MSRLGDLTAFPVGVEIFQLEICGTLKGSRALQPFNSKAIRDSWLAMAALLVTACSALPTSVSVSCVASLGLEARIPEISAALARLGSWLTR